jgi:hypothetical protein
MSRQVPHAEDIATGPPTAGLVPISAGPGLAPAWGAGGGGGGSSGLQRCSALLSEAASLPVVNNTVVQVLLDTDEYDPDDWHSTATNTHRITVPEDGDYAIFGRFTWENDASTGDVGTRTLTINGTGPGGFYGASRVDPASSTVSHLHQELTHAVHLAAGTSCWMEVLQNSGGTLQAALASNRRENPRLTVVRLDASAAGGGSGDWTELVTYTVPAGPGQHEIDFPGLDQGYKELVAAGENLHTVDSAGGTGANVGLRFNTDDGSDYRNSFHRFGRVSAVGVHDSGFSTNAYAALSQMPGDVGTDADIGDRGHFVLWLPGYSTAGTPYKFCRGNGGFSYFSDIEERDFHTRWLGGVPGPKQLGPITQLTFIANVGSTVNFAPGSRITIYGVGPI